VPSRQIEYLTFLGKIKKLERSLLITGFMAWLGVFSTAGASQTTLVTTDTITFGQQISLRYN
jgi:hypothetical protein